MNDKPLIFISHAGPDTKQAQAIAQLLKDMKLSVILDALDMNSGQNIIEFMDSALQRSDYCLLLWSRQAQDRDYVRVEWQAAFVKEITLKRIFLLVGRLEDHPLPTLLQPRLHVNLFPDIAHGVDKLASTWLKDRRAASSLMKDVLPPLTASNTTGSSQCEIYCSSELFDCTIPLPTNLDKPAGILLDTIIERLSLPRSLSVMDRIGMQFSYRLLYKNSLLERHLSLAEQGVQPESILLLEITTENFAAVPATSTYGAKQVFRNSPEIHQALIQHLAQIGLRS